MELKELESKIQALFFNKEIKVIYNKKKNNILISLYFIKLIEVDLKEIKLKEKSLIVKRSRENTLNLYKEAIDIFRRLNKENTYKELEALIKENIKKYL